MASTGRSGSAALSTTAGAVELGAFLALGLVAGAAWFIVFLADAAEACLAGATLAGAAGALAVFFFGLATGLAGALGVLVTGFFAPAGLEGAGLAAALGLTSLTSDSATRLIALLAFTGAATFLAGAFFAGTLLAEDFFATLAATFFAGAFLATGLATGLAGAFFTTFFATAGFFATGFFAAGLAAGLRAATALLEALPEVFAFVATIWTLTPYALRKSSRVL